MKAYKVELLIIDFDHLGRESVQRELENVRYANDCLSPSVMAIEERDIGEWDDSHPLNHRNKKVPEYQRLFAAAQEAEKSTYYMRDNHTFRELPNDLEAALRGIEEDLDAGFTSGGLFTKRRGATSLDFSYKTPRTEMMSQARDWLTAELTARTMQEAAREQPADERKDAELLQFLIDEECHVESLALGNGTHYRVYWPQLAEAQVEWHEDPRNAIEAARRALAEKGERNA